MTETYTIIGAIVHFESKNNLQIIKNGFVSFSNGKILEVGMYKPTFDQGEDTTCIRLRPDQFLMPGLIDTHIHAPQYPNIGLGYDKTLMDWLDTYTFPLEQKYDDLAFAKKVYKAVVRRTVTNGTTTATYFATIHPESSNILADAAIALGQRALIGKVNMNQCCPDNYTETTAQSLSDTEAFVETIIKKGSPLVQPIVTPRFAISCDMKLMKSLAKIAKKHNLHIQTHISESVGEVAEVKLMYPDCSHYVDVYDRAGLLTNKTILAHGVHLTAPELAVLRERGASVSHCPNSNTALRSGLCDVRRLQASGVRVGLGTDVSGGSSPSVVDAMRCALTTSIHLGYSRGHDYEPLTYKDVLYLATLGGAEALAMDSEIGNFAVGKSFDALVVTMDGEGSPIDILGEYTTSEYIQKFIYMGDERNITQVFVGGKLLKSSKGSSTQFAFFRDLNEEFIM